MHAHKHKARKFCSYLVCNNLYIAMYGIVHNVVYLHICAWPCIHTHLMGWRTAGSGPFDLAGRRCASARPHTAAQLSSALTQQPSQLQPSRPSRPAARQQSDTSRSHSRSAADRVGRSRRPVIGREPPPPARTGPRPAGVCVISRERVVVPCGSARSAVSARTTRTRCDDERTRGQHSQRSMFIYNKVRYFGRIVARGVGGLKAV